MISDAAGSGDRLVTLRALRDRLAQEIDQCDQARDVAALALRLTDVLSQIDAIPNTEAVSAADELANRRSARRNSSSAG